MEGIVIYKGFILSFLIMIVSVSMVQAKELHELSEAEIRQLAEQGDADAQRRLAFMYEFGFFSSDGRDEELDNQEAMKWYRMAAEQGHAGAQNSLGGAYFEGIIVERDYEQAREWFRKAAAQGKKDAQNNLERVEKILQNQ